MTDRHNDINDDQIRIITSDDSGFKKKRNRKGTVALWCIASVLLIGMVIALVFFIPEKEKEQQPYFSETQTGPTQTETQQETSISTETPYTIRRDTTVNNIRLSILIPTNATPVLEIGNDVLNDSTPILITQAADIRKDNGSIVGTFVVKGILVSRGEAKSGFCSIINGEVNLGVADASPMFEEAIINDGYFFRQYPLVAGGQIIENKPRGKSVRRALAEIDGNICVITSRDRITFHDFSQALIDTGVRDAIYLVGGGVFCRYRNESGKNISSGQPWDEKIENVNYIVWR